MFSFRRPRPLPTFVTGTVAAILMMSWNAFAVPIARGPDAVPANCLSAAAAEWYVPVDALRLILVVEGGAIGECSSNTNGTIDCGPGQINSVWYPIIARGRVSPEAIRDALASDPCYNIRVTAWILRREIDAVGWDNFWTAMGNYHSRTPELREAYLRRVARAARTMALDAANAPR